MQEQKQKKYRAAELALTLRGGNFSLTVRKIKLLKKIMKKKGWSVLRGALAGSSVTIYINLISPKNHV